MNDLRRTPLFETHRQSNAQLVEFGGWEMPVQYPDGIIKEHLATRTGAGIFDVSHMGRLYFRGEQALAFLQHVLTNNAAALDVGESQYTLIQNDGGGAVDDAYLYRFDPDEYLLVVNASNREKDIAHFRDHLPKFPGVTLDDQTFDKAMISLQGPASKALLLPLLTQGGLPEPARNHLSRVEIRGIPADMARTGYTGEPLGFELFVAKDQAAALWQILADAGAAPIGLGARDTLRLEAGYSLYGHELSEAISPVEAGLGWLVNSTDDYIGKDVLTAQKEGGAPRKIVCLKMIDKGIPRDTYPVAHGGGEIGVVTSGGFSPTFDVGVALALVTKNAVSVGDRVDVMMRGKPKAAEVVSRPLYVYNG